MPVCFKTPLLYLLTQKVAQKFGYVLGIGKRQGSICHDERWRIDPSSYPDVCSVDDMGVCSAFEILTFPETFLPFSLHFQNKSLSLQST